VSIPLPSSDIGPFNYILNSAQLLKLVTADFVCKRFPMYRPYYLHLCGLEKLLGMGKKVQQILFYEEAFST
jgi:hypothetical protein